ncbi:response regulator, partial [bacterium]|nr:response regulator [bacterium]
MEKNLFLNKSAIKILLLDDEPFMLKLLAQMLRHLGYSSLSTCESGRAALDLFADPGEHPDLILLDLNMPEMDGVEFVRHLVEHRYSGGLILVSGEDERMLQSVEKLVRAHKITVLGYLTKPVTPALLAALIERWHPPAQDARRASKKIYSADEIRVALANGQLLNYFQPKVLVMTGEVIGVETLVRWQHPIDGLVFPD